MADDTAPQDRSSGDAGESSLGRLSRRGLLQATGGGVAALGLLETDLVTASDAEPLVDPDSLTATNPAATVTDARGGEATASRTVDESDGDAGPGAASDRPAGSSHLQS